MGVTVIGLKSEQDVGVGTLETGVMTLGREGIHHQIQAISKIIQN